MPDFKMKELLRRYLEGRATPEEEKLVDDWYDSLTQEDERTLLSDEERTILRKSYWESLKINIHQPASRTVILWPRLLALAASVSAIVVLTLLLLSPNGKNSKVLSVAASASGEEIVNDLKVIREIRLSDNSLVRLFPGSKLGISHDFNLTERKIYLSGQAFFEIAHNKDRPFYVFANEVVTKVLGTTFSVKAYPEDVSITVAVTSGKVSVYTHSKKDSILSESPAIILTPNQQAIYTRKDNRVLRTLVKEPQIVLSQEEVKKIRFEGEPVSEIFKVLEKMYGVDIVFEEDKFSRCSITTSVTGSNLYERIDVICEIIGATYETQDTRIIITGAGCN